MLLGPGRPHSSQSVPVEVRETSTTIQGEVCVWGGGGKCVGVWVL